MEENIKIYTLDQLLTKKISKKEPKHTLFVNLIKQQFESIGEMDKDYKWAISHNKEGLDWFNLFSITDEQYTEYKNNMIKVLKKQLGIGKKQAEVEFAYFAMNYGWPQQDISKDSNNIPWDTILCERIYTYEQDNGELVYDDGFEKILKERIQYNDYLKNKK